MRKILVFWHSFSCYLRTILDFLAHFQALPAGKFCKEKLYSPPGQVRPPASHLTNSLKINCTMYYTWVELGICTTGYSGRHKYGAFLKSRCFKSKYLLIQYVHDSDVWVFFSKRSWFSPSLTVTWKKFITFLSAKALR